MICIAANSRAGYRLVPRALINLIRREMDQLQPAASIASTLQAKSLGLEGERSRATREPVVVVDVGRASPGKPVGAVVAATNVLRALHGSERPLYASEGARPTTL